jgi:hypothetical protein
MKQGELMGRCYFLDGDYVTFCPGVKHLAGGGNPSKLMIR